MFGTRLLGRIQDNLNRAVGETRPSFSELGGAISSIGSDPNAILAKGLKERNRWLVQFAIQKVANLSIPNEHGYSPLAILLMDFNESGDDEMTARIMQLRSLTLLETPEPGGVTLLHLAAAFGKPATVKCLLEMGFNDKTPTQTGQLAIHAGHIHLDILKMLLEKFEDDTLKAQVVLQICIDGGTHSIISSSAFFGYVDHLQYLLAIPAVVQELNTNPSHARSIVTSIQSDAIAQLFKEKTAIYDVFAKDILSNSPPPLDHVTPDLTLDDLILNNLSLMGKQYIPSNLQYSSQNDSQTDILSNRYTNPATNDASHLSPNGFILRKRKLSRNSDLAE